MFYFNFSNIFKLSNFYILSLFLVGFSACAEENQPPTEMNKDLLINRVVEAYGGDKLLKLTSFEKLERRKNFNIGQSPAPGETFESKVNFHTLFDPVNNRAVLESWYSHDAGSYHNSEIFDGETGYTVDFGIHGYTDNPDSTPAGVIWIAVRSSSPLLVKDIYEQREGAEYIGTEEVDGKIHEVLKYNFQGNVPYFVYIDPETYLVTKISRTVGSGSILDYSYSGYVEEDGILHETGYKRERDGQLDHETTFISYKFDQPLEEKYFTVPEGFFGPIESDDVSSMLVNKISENAYHIGSGFGYTIFVDVGDYLIASGGYRGLTQRVEEYRKVTGSSKTLKFLVITHHHVDHLGGMAEANDLGVIFVTVAENVDSIKEAAGAEIPDERFLLINGSRTFGPEDGERVVVYEFDSPHANRFLMSYLPVEKILFTVDHFGTLYTNALPAANADSIYLEKKIEEMGLDVEGIVSAHMPRTFSIEDLKASNKLVLDPCFEKRPVCSE